MEAASAELARPEPRRVVLTSLLGTVLGAVGGVASLVTQVEGMTHAVGSIF